ncbi:MAG: HD domain-containing protein [Acidobacteria bacterium]|nr:HD domain-containing protein [Acidobacteriota bacterium]
MQAERLSPIGPPEPAAAVPVMDVIAGLSRALDITEGHPTGHAARSCVIGMRLAQACGLDETALADLFHALLLKDVGCSSNAARVHQLAGGRDHEVKRSVWMTDWRSWPEKIAHSLAWVGRGEPLGRRLGRLAHLAWLGPRAEQEIFQIRCDRGAAIALDLGLSRTTAEAIRAMDEHWDGGGQPARLRGNAIPLAAQIIGIAQVIEIFWQQHGVEAARAVVRRRRRRWFSPELSRLALALLDDAALWRALGDVASIELLHDVAPAPAMLRVTEAHLDRIVDAFAGVIDAKSPYTHDHSRRVADYAVAAAARLGFSGARLVRLRRAALLHDIGKLGVSNSILDKPGALSAEEWQAMRGHTRHTLEILDAVPIFRELAVDAAAHHERLNGTGYHLGLRGAALTPSARVLAVADVTDALRSDRPYRAGLEVERVVAMLGDDAASGKMCPQSVAAMTEVLRA